MPSSCAVINCTSQKHCRNPGEILSFHRFPKDPERRLEWCNAVRMQTSALEPFTLSNNSVLCSKHFTEDMFDRTGQTVRLRDKAIPSVFSLQTRKRTKHEATKGPIPHKKRNNAGLLRKGEKNWEESNKETAQSTASGLGELALAAELMEECQQEIQKGFQNDHSVLPLPSDPAQLCGLVRNLAKERHWQGETLLSLRKDLKSKDAQLQEKTVGCRSVQPLITSPPLQFCLGSTIELERVMACQREADQSKVCSLEKTLSQQRLELLKIQEELAQTRKQLKEKSEALHCLAAVRQVPPSCRPSMFSIKALCRGSAKWLRFYTGIRSYSRFQALLAFLQDTNGSVLDWNDQGEEERGDEEEEERMSEKNENRPCSDPPQTEASLYGIVLIKAMHYLHLFQYLEPTLQVSEDYASTASPIPDSDWSWEETAETVRLRFLGTRRGEEGRRHALSPEDQLLLVLTRLRLGLLIADLSFRFHVAEATVSRVWVHWVELMQKRLQQIPVRCSPHYVSVFQPKHTLSYGPGRQLTVLQCADLLCGSSKQERQQMARRTHIVSDGQHLSSLPYRFLCNVRACAVASSDGYLGFCSSTRLDEWQEWTASQDDPKPLTLPAFVIGGEGSEPLAGMPVREVLSIKSLTDKAMKYHYLRVVHPHRSEALLDQAWEVCCYLACLLHQPMGLR
ncbi:uncharacterized protein [Salminus brasiliensis]|uniref:uncharacterized protein n=1 Tax=Salminus brasiliensis TaxID=930266 RepID=UPI003B82CA58